MYFTVCDGDNDNDGDYDGDDDDNEDSEGLVQSRIILKNDTQNETDDGMTEVVTFSICMPNIYM